MTRPGNALIVGEAYREALARIVASPDWKAVESLLRIEERNIVIQAFKVNSSDPDLARKKAHLEGRVYEIRKFLKTFEYAMKGEDEG